MTTQMDLFESAPVSALEIDPTLVCAFGWPIQDRSQEVPTGYGERSWHCKGCAENGERLCAAFEADVAAGKYDRDGYTPAERRAVVRKKGEQS